MEGQKYDPQSEGFLIEVKFKQCWMVPPQYNTPNTLEVQV